MSTGSKPNTPEQPTGQAPAQSAQAQAQKRVGYESIATNFSLSVSNLIGSPDLRDLVAV